MVADRGEAATHVLRTLREMEIESVSVYAYEDRFSRHRDQADKSFLIGAGRKPAEAYNDVDSIIEVAKKNGIDAIHPGHGALARRPEFAERVIASGISFIGPPLKVVRQMSDRLSSQQCAQAANVKVIPGTPKPITTPEEAVKVFKELNCPIILKPVRGNAKEGFVYVDDLSRVAEAFEIASTQARKLFGDGSMVIEKFLDHPRSIEVQVLADHYGNAVHLFDTDCSLQLRQRKYLQVAPTRDIDDNIREKLFADALAVVRQAGYQNAGSVQFLLDFSGEHYFIGVNACLPAEHALAEEVTGIDIVHAQIRIAEGESLEEMGLTQDSIKLNGAAIQCRINAEDPGNNFQPQSGRLKVYRIGGGMGIRKDSLAYDGEKISPHYEPVLCKVIAHASTHQTAAKRMLRCLRDSKIRGLESNLAFLQNVLADPTFNDGIVTTSFLDDNTTLLEMPQTPQTGLKLLRYMAEVKVNGAFSPLGVPDATVWRSKPQVPKVANGTANNGFKNVLQKAGPSGYAKAIRNHQGVLITDTTFRDANQSLLATRVRTHDMLKIAPFISQHLSGLRSIENWGGATFQVCMNFLYECPWERLERLRKAIPNIPFQCIFRGANVFGYSSFPDNAINDFCKLAVQTGMDIFRVMDCFNYLPNLICGIEAVGKAGGVVEGAIVYTGDVTNKNSKKYTLKYYLDLVDQLVKAGIHILAIKDMAGVLHPSAARLLVGSIRIKYPDLPIQVHTHDTAGTGVAAMIAAVEAGADGVDASIDSMSGITSQPSMGAIVRSMEHTPVSTGLDLDAISTYNRYWAETRRLYSNFECTDLLKSGNSDVFEHHIPGGQYSNLAFQSFSLNLYDKFPLVCRNYDEANKALGDIIKVAPSSKVVGDLALFMTQNGITSSEELLEKAGDYDLPNSVKDFFEGKLGQPTYGFPKRLQEKVLRGRKPKITGRPGAALKPIDFDYEKRKLEEKHHQLFSDKDTMSSVMFPKEFECMRKYRTEFGPVEYLPTDVFFAGPEHHHELEIEFETGRKLFVRLTSIGQVDEDGRRQVHFEYNGQERSVFVEDREFAKKKHVRAKEDKADIAQHGAPMKGLIVELKVSSGCKVERDQDLFVLASMKMEIAVKSKVAGVVKAVLFPVGTHVEAQDLVVIVDPT
ncbi:hypothetical protein Q1695_002468 [Nippostrongylus brasiliensis]|nr:hypothetical protein Q1695_002468 [Nippostrongylus brasiliensis]